MVNTLWLAGLCRIDLPGHTIRLCDGAFVDFASERYEAADPLLGSIQGFKLTGSGPDKAPAGHLTFVGSTLAGRELLLSPAAQGSRVSMWQAEVDPETNGVIGNPVQLVDGLFDRGVLRGAKGARMIDIEWVSHGERMMVLNEGNGLSSGWHKRNFPNETGFDNAIGTQVTVAWGAPSPPRGVSGASGGLAALPGMFMAQVR